MLPNSNIPTKEFNIRDYLNIIIRHKWIIITFIVIFVTFAAIKSFKATPVYKASTIILINRQNPNIVSFDEILSLDSRGSKFYNNQEKILQSRSLARKVINSLDLKNSQEFKSNKKAKNFSMRRFIRGIVKKHSSEKELQKSEGTKKIDEDYRLVNRYLSRLKIKPLKDSSFVNISFRGTHPDIVTNICNTHAQKFVETSLEIRFAATQDAVEWLQKHLLEKKEILEKAENALQVYKEKQNIVSLEERQNIIVQKLEDLNSALTNARTKRIGLETLFKQTINYSEDPKLIESIPQVMNNPLIQELKTKSVDLQTEITNLSDKYGKKHPHMISIISKTKKMENMIQSEIDKIIKSIETEYKVASAEEENLAQALEAQKKVALNLNRKAISYSRLKREADSERALYNVLLKRMKETDIAGELKTSNIRIIDMAETPRSPINPSKERTILLGALVGLSFGIGLGFILDYLDKTIKSTEDVEHYLGLTLLGLVEKVRLPKDKEASPIEIVSHEMPKSVLSESVRNVRTGIMFSTTDIPNKLLLVTSTKQGEGKTFVAANLCITIAQTEKTTLLVDTDFRKPRVHKIFDVAIQPGLSNHFLGEVDLESIIKPTSVPNLSVITCGIIPPNPSELLGSHNMETFCNTIREKFDTVIFDTPPSMMVTDAVVLSRIMDGVVFVIRSGHTEKGLAKRAVLQFTKNKRELLGVVMNLMDVKKGGYYNYSGYYKYGYGYDSDDDSSIKKKKKGKRYEHLT